MATEALMVNLGKAIQNDLFITGLFTDHEILCINGMIKLWITFFLESNLLTWHATRFCP